MSKHSRNIPKVQIVGLFNTGSNLAARLVDSFFRVNVHHEGHTVWWKHSMITQHLLDQHLTKDLKIIVVVKNPYWWFHSMFKSQYGIEIDTETPKKIGEFIKENITVKIPKKLKVIADNTNNKFENLPQYWCEFYKNALKLLPKGQFVVVRYCDILHKPHKVLKNLEEFIPQKFWKIKPKHPRRLSVQKNEMNLLYIKPTKNHGNPRYGKEAKDYYNLKNIPKLFKSKTFEWIKENIDEELMTVFKYKTI